MDGSSYQQFFLQPEDPWHRRYEALRAVFVEGESMADVAERLGVAHGTVRNWASEFRSQQDQGQAPPFFVFLRADAGPMTRIPRKRTHARRSPTCSNCRLQRAAGSAHASPASSCSGPCSRSCGSIGSSLAPIIPAPRWSPPCRP